MLYKDLYSPSAFGAYGTSGSSGTKKTALSEVFWVPDGGRTQILPFWGKLLIKKDSLTEVFWGA